MRLNGAEHPNTANKEMHSQTDWKAFSSKQYDKNVEPRTNKKKSKKKTILCLKSTIKNFKNFKNKQTRLIRRIINFEDRSIFSNNKKNIQER